LQHFRGGMDHWDPLMTDGVAADREVILYNGCGVASSDFQEVMWFQGLTAFLQPPKIVAPCDRSVF
jgi:hypothetical protein